MLKIGASGAADETGVQLLHQPESDVLGPLIWRFHGLGLAGELARRGYTG
jgi:hypothetical protein